MTENMRALWQADTDAVVSRLVCMGKVTATSPLTVQVDGETASRGVTRLASYSPTVNDRVLLLRTSAGKYTVMGKVI